VTCPPLVAYLTEALYGEEGILYADLDRDGLTAASFDFDPVGRCARPDVFSFAVNEGSQGKWIRLARLVTRQRRCYDGLVQNHQ